MLEWDQPWKFPPRDVHLQEREVHIWRASLTPYKQAIQRLEDILSAEECTQASRFRFERDRQCWTVTHAILRLLLARYLGIDHTTLRFGMNAYGKPFLASPALTPPFQFNISHAGDLALYAFVYTAQVGIDVEYLRTDLDYEALARVSFSPWEQMTLRAVPQERKPEAFFSCWTRKEAYIKARGLGLSLPLDLFDVSFIQGERPALLHSREDPHEITRWSLHELMPGMGYVGTLALEGVGWILRYWQWQT